MKYEGAGEIIVGRIDTSNIFPDPHFPSLLLFRTLSQLKNCKLCGGGKCKKFDWGKMVIKENK